MWDTLQEGQRTHKMRQELVGSRGTTSPSSQSIQTGLSGKVGRGFAYLNLCMDPRDFWPLFGRHSNGAFSV